MSCCGCICLGHGKRKTRAKGMLWWPVGNEGMDNKDNSNKLRVCSLLKFVSWSGAWEVFVVFSKT